MGEWKYECSEYILVSSRSVAAAASIGKLTQNHTFEDFNAILREIPMAVPAVDELREPVWSCRVWVREALRRLHNAGYIECSDVDAMEEEMLGYGRAAAAGIESDEFSIAALVKARNSK